MSAPAPHLAVVHPAPAVVARGPVARSDDWRHDLPAERAVLASCLLDPEAWDVVAPLVAEGDFYHPAHGVIFAAMAAVRARGEPIDVLTVCAQLRQADRLNTVGGAQVLGELTDTIPMTAWCDVHARLIVERAARRRAVEHAEAFVARAKSGAPLGAELADVMAKLDAVPLPVAGTPTLEADVEHHAAVIEGTAERRRLLPTGCAALDRALGGGLASGVVMLLGLPGAGKTTLALQWAIHAATHAGPVYFWSGEQGRDEVVVSALATAGAVPLDVARDPRRNRPTPDQAVRLDRAFNDVHGMALHVADDTTKGRPLTVAGIVAAIRALNATAKARGGKRVVLAVVDNLLELEPREKHRNAWDAVIANMDDLRRARKLLGIPIVVICHPNGDPMKGHLYRRLRTGDIAGGKAVGRKADAILCLHREDVHPTRDHKKDPAVPGLLQVYSDKVRGVGRVYAELMELKSEHRFISTGDAGAEPFADPAATAQPDRDVLDDYGAGDGLPDCGPEQPLLDRSEGA